MLTEYYHVIPKKECKGAEQCFCQLKRQLASCVDSALHVKLQTFGEKFWLMSVFLPDNAPVRKQHPKME